MKKTLLNLAFLLAAGLTFTLFSCKAAEKEYIDEYGCYEDISTAIDSATNDNKNILLVITMNGDDPESDKFTEDFFKSNDYKSKIASNYTMLHFDLGQKTFERTVAGANASKKEQEAADEFAEILQMNCRFAELLAVNYTPCLFVLTKQGYFITQIPTTPGEYSPSKILPIIESFNNMILEFNELAAASEKGSVEERVKAIDTLYERTDESHRILLMDLTRKVVDIDFDNKSGLLSKYLFETAINLAMYCSMDNDIEGAVKCMVSVCSNQNLEPKDKQNAWYMAAYILLSSYSTDFTSILTYLEAALMSDPDSDFAPQIQQLYDYVKNTVESSSVSEEAK
ncbi:MAG: hypothetical protein K5829_08460 [Treponema sp.]|nr:hypothetical protein [Treponema sp.]